MIYEAAVMADERTSAEELAPIKEVFKQVLAAEKGEILLDDDWGLKTLAQPTRKKANKGHIVYYIYKAPSTANKEIKRLLGINEKIMRSMIVRLGADNEQEKILKQYERPIFTR